MKFITIVFIIFFSYFLQGCGEEKKPQSATITYEKVNPRLIDLNPNAWKDLPVKTVISDFQASDGIFSSFICNEIRKRLSMKPLKTLRALKEIEKSARIRAFNNCLSPEVKGSSGIIKAINAYSKEFPQLTGEITDATGLKRQ